MIPTLSISCHTSDCRTSMPSWLSWQSVCLVSRRSPVRFWQKACSFRVWPRRLGSTIFWMRVWLPVFACASFRCLWAGLRRYVLLRKGGGKLCKINSPSFFSHRSKGKVNLLQVDKCTPGDSGRRFFRREFNLAREGTALAIRKQKGERGREEEGRKQNKKRERLVCCPDIWRNSCEPHAELQAERALWWLRQLTKEQKSVILAGIEPTTS
ncbi:hypothetical protein GQ42DRAFT_50424 [Ramicandelaber brevisporus]|nr:hypothetical protein GQ42DRAFT_50424 [Ramicandelaber brevisporus]